MTPLTPQEYRTIVDAAPMLIWRSDLSRGCDWFNSTWLSFTGRTFDQELGDGWTEGVHEDDRQEAVAAYLAHFDRREPFELIYRLRRADGEYRWIADRGSPFDDEGGAFAGYIGACIDITERVLAEQALDLAHSRALEGLRHVLPMCASCKRVRTPDGSWEAVEQWLGRRAAADVSHGVCPTCLEELYGPRG